MMDPASSVRFGAHLVIQPCRYRPSRHLLLASELKKQLPPDLVLVFHQENIPGAFSFHGGGMVWETVTVHRRIPETRLVRLGKWLRGIAPKMDQTVLHEFRKNSGSLFDASIGESYRGFMYRVIDALKTPAVEVQP